MEIILNAGLGVGFLMALILLFKKEKGQVDIFFLSWIVLSLLQIGFYTYTIYHGHIAGFLAIFLFGIPLLSAPFLFLYIKKLTGNLVRTSTIIAHSVVFVLYVSLLYFYSIKTENPFFAEDGYLLNSAASSLLNDLYAIPMAVSAFYYLIADLILLRNHRKRISNSFSFKEGINLEWVDYVVLTYFVLFILACFVIFGATQFQLFPIKDAFSWVGIVLSLMLVTFGFLGFRQTTIFHNSIEVVTPTDDLISIGQKASYAKSGLTPEKSNDLKNILLDYLEREKPYLDENLSLQGLADQCKIPSAQLSQLINQQFEMSFYDFINQYRVEEVKVRMVSSEFAHFTLLGIGNDCGFKSKASFNRYFKKYTGFSPSEFKKNSINGPQPIG